MQSKVSIIARQKIYLLVILILYIYIYIVLKYNSIKQTDDV